MNRQNTLKLVATQGRPYGCDPYNTAAAMNTTQHVVRNYHGPLSTVAYRDQRYWDFAAGVSSVEKLASYRPAL